MFTEKLTVPLESSFISKGSFLKGSGLKESCRSSICSCQPWGSTECTCA